MKAYVLRRIGPITADTPPLSLEERPAPIPGPAEVRLRVLACGVCHTELDEIEGRTPPQRLPRVPGHQVVGLVDAVGPRVPPGEIGKRVGVAWIADSCGACRYCQTGRENLCSDFVATGRDVDGGYSEYMTALASAVVPIPDVFSDTDAAPLLCAGAVGYRALRLAGLANGQALGLTGFGASGHIVLQLARALLPDSPVLVFARNAGGRSLAMRLGAAWAGDTVDEPPIAPDAIIDTTPAWTPVIRALEMLAPGGRLIVNAIRKESADRSALADLDYARHLWHEKGIQSVANVTRADVRDTLRLAARLPVSVTATIYEFTEANRALQDLRQDHALGAKVLRVQPR